MEYSPIITSLMIGDVITSYLPILVSSEAHSDQTSSLSMVWNNRWEIIKVCQWHLPFRVFSDTYTSGIQFN